MKLPDALNKLKQQRGRHNANCNVVTLGDLEAIIEAWDLYAAMPSVAVEVKSVADYYKSAPNNSHPAKAAIHAEKKTIILNLRKKIDGYYRDGGDSEPEDDLDRSSPRQSNARQLKEPAAQPSSPPSSIEPRPTKRRLAQQSPRPSKRVAAPHVPDMDGIWPDAPIFTIPQMETPFDFNRREYSRPSGITRLILEDKEDEGETLYDEEWHLTEYPQLRDANERWLNGMPEWHGPQCEPGYVFVSSEYPRKD